MTDELGRRIDEALAQGPASARELARALGAERSDINSALYAGKDRYRNDGGSPPVWSLQVGATTANGRSEPRSKQEAIDLILAALGSTLSLKVGPGSTEPKAIFVEVVRQLSLPLDEGASKVDLARGIAARAQLAWPSDGDSTETPSGGGDTVTLSGLRTVLVAVEKLSGSTAPAPGPPVLPPAAVGTPYVRRTGGIAAEPALTVTDWDAMDAATKAHMSLQNRIADEVERAGLTPLGPGVGDPQFDIAWRPRGRFVVCEVKSSSDANARQQLRLGLGQVLEYRIALAALVGVDVLAAVACEVPPPRDTHRAITASGVRLIRSDSLEEDLAPLL